ncbi:MAG: winged helix-turn-helix domain-containing protein [Acidimicrobiales bacterium]
MEYGPIALNVETYQASLDGRPLDLTYMEYELLRFLTAQPGKVFTRETLLNRVWGYEYYGGARTVDVHVTSPPGQARRGTRQPDPDHPVGRLQARPVPLGLSEVLLYLA